MNFKKILNKEISFTKTTFYITILIVVAIGILSAFYLPEFLKYIGLDFLSDNYLFISFIVMILSSISVLTNMIFSKHRRNIEPSNNDAFSKHINELERASDSIKSLEKFIVQQKSDLVKNKKTLDKLNPKRKKLKPIVESEKELVDSILSIQTENQSKKVFKERFIGFFLGLLSSAIASLVIWYFTK